MRFCPGDHCDKADKISRLQIRTQTEKIREMLPGPSKDQIMIIPFSSVTREGKEQILDLMEQFCGLTAPEGGRMPDSAGNETAGKPENTEALEMNAAEAASVKEQSKQKDRWPKERKKARKKTDRKKSGKKNTGKRK